MSSLSSAELPTIAGQITTTLLPNVRKIDTHDDSNTLSIIIAVSIVFILSPVTISSNTLILAAFYRFKRLRTASNWLLASLAVSDFGVGIFMPFGVHLELSGIPKTGVTSLCIIPYCIIIALCCVSVLVTVAIAVDRLTSLAQPLRYKNIITHSSVEKYIAVFWIYAIAVGLTPLVYAKAIGIIQPQSGSCRFGAAVQPPVRVFLVVAVWAPSALVLLGCYIYVYLVARAHARAIYTVELSFRHETQTLTLPRYGQTLALTVGAFLVLWLPLQTCMLLDIFCGTKILTEWSVFWLGLPILAHSGLNPWIYAFHHGEMRVAAGKIAEDLVILFGIHPSRYGCSPMHRPSNFELADINNKSNEEDQRPPVEDCFAAKYTASTYYPMQKKLSNNDTDISPEENDSKNFTNCANVSAIIEEESHDMVKMLGQDYVNDRNTIIDSNHNIDKIKNLKYLLDPTFNKIRYLRRLNNNKNGICLVNKNNRHFNESKFKSYQYLNHELINKKSINVNTMSEPMLNNTETNFDDSQDTINESLNREILRLKQRRNSGLSSLSDPNIKGINNSIIKYSQLPDYHGHSIQSLDKQPKSIQPRQNNSLKYQQIKTKKEIITKWRQASRQLTITANKLTNLFHTDNNNHNHTINYHDKLNKSSLSSRKNINCLKYSESIVGIERTESSSSSRYLVPNGKIDLLTLPRIRSEPPSPIDPRPLGSLLEEESSNDDDDEDDDDDDGINYPQFSRRNSSKCSVRYSDPVPYVLLNIEDFDGDGDSFNDQGNQENDDVQKDKLSNDILKSTDKKIDKILGENLFVEHDSTRFNSRRPSDLRWSESSRSQEFLSNLNNHRLSPSSYSVHNYDECTSSGDLNDANFGSFMSPSNHESIPNNLTKIKKDNLKLFDDKNNTFNCGNSIISTAHSSVSSINVKYCNENSKKIISQSKSTESVINDGYRHAILKTKLRGSINEKIQLKIGGNFLLNDSNNMKIKKNNIFKISEFNNSTSNDISTSTKIDGSGDIKCTNGSIGVRV